MALVETERPARAKSTLQTAEGPEEKTTREMILLPAIHGERGVGPSILIRKEDLEKPGPRGLLLSIGAEDHRLTEELKVSGEGAEARDLAAKKGGDSPQCDQRPRRRVRGGNVLHSIDQVEVDMSNSTKKKQEHSTASCICKSLREPSQEISKDSASPPRHDSEEIVDSKAGGGSLGQALGRREGELDTFLEQRTPTHEFGREIPGSTRKSERLREASKQLREVQELLGYPGELGTREFKGRAPRQTTGMEMIGLIQGKEAVEEAFPPVREEEEYKPEEEDKGEEQAHRLVACRCISSGTERRNLDWFEGIEQ